MPVLPSAPVRGRIIESVDVRDDGHRSEITIRFTFPLRYEHHFPLYEGDLLRISLLPLAVAEVDVGALFKRESAVPRPVGLAPLLEVVYEGDFSAQGTNLYLYFSREVAFDVVQGADFRSIVVYVRKQEISTEGKHCQDC